MTHEEALVKVRGYLTDYLPLEDVDEIDEIIEALEQKPKTWNLDDAREDFMYDVYNTLDFLPTNNEANQIIDIFDRVTGGIRREQKWISVSERLPEEGCEYLCTIQTCSIYTNKVIDKYINFCDFMNGGWCVSDNETVIAWMPLPLPWKEE